MNNLYPLFFKIAQRPVLVVGGGQVAEQKIKSLLECRASITVIAPQVTAWIELLALMAEIKLLCREFRAIDADGFSLIIGATDNKKVQRAIFHEAQLRNIPVNIVDVPELSTFYLGAIFHEGDLKIAVSTNGKSPTLGKMIRDKIQQQFSSGFAGLLDSLGELRQQLQNQLPTFNSRKFALQERVKAELAKFYQDRSTDNVAGRVYLVGAGPGDPELITVKALRLIESADLIIYDALVNRSLLSLAKESAQFIDVGKRAGQHCCTQSEINQLLIDKARAGLTVVRLKGGDPFIFGRGGEELAALREANIAVETVPGITAGIGIPTSLGIPLTHRKIASSVLFVTGHTDGEKDPDQIDWPVHTAPDTLVIYMGMKRIRELMRKMIERGYAPSTPVAVIFAGTWPEEFIIDGTIEEIANLIEQYQTTEPGLIIVGNVVNFWHNRTAINEREVAEAYCG